jgi:AbiU2
MGQSVMPMPAQITPVWNVIYDETVEVHAYWKLFNQLFGVSQDQIELLNRSAGFCFYAIEDALGTDIQRTLSKLSDPAQTGAKENATIGYLLNEVRRLQRPSSVDELQRLCQNFTASCQSIRARRNKMIAHADRAIALRTAAPPPDATIGQINGALQALRDFMYAVAIYLEEPLTAYEHVIMRGQGGDDLVSLLRMAERYQILQTEGTNPWSDLP